MKECIFCKIAAREIPAEIIYEDSEVVAFKDINPQAPIHALIIPKKHIEKISDINGSNSGIIAGLAVAANKIAQEQGISKSGYRLVLNCEKDAGQEVYHIHMHLLGGRKMAWPPG